MNSTKKERNLLYELSFNVSESTMEESGSFGTYYLPVANNGIVMQEYSFDNIMELRNELLSLWENDEKMLKYIPVVLASIFKNSPLIDEGKAKVDRNKNNDNDLLPTFTYTM